ncbi:hypothetical protein CUZ93_1504 [Enterococcus xinjiangensis]|nr:hypothetical protein [Enterococcus lactis]
MITEKFRNKKQLSEQESFFTLCLVVKHLILAEPLVSFFQ